MCSYRLTLAVMNGHQPTPVRHRTMSVRADGPLEAARRAEDLCNVLLDRTSGSELWAQTTSIKRMDVPEPDHSEDAFAAPLPPLAAVLAM